MAQGPGSEDANSATLACTGSISVLRRSFGFIKSSEFATDVFFHHSACLQDDLAAGDTVEFMLDAEQQRLNRKVATRVWRTSKQPELISIDGTTRYGCVASFQFSPQCSSGVLQYINQQGELQNLTFNQQGLSPCVTSSDLRTGAFVKFKVLIDNRQKAQAEAAGLSGHRIQHSYLRATEIELLPVAEQEVLDPQMQRQLKILQAVSESLGCKS